MWLIARCFSVSNLNMAKQAMEDATFYSYKILYIPHPGTRSDMDVIWILDVICLFMHYFIQLFIYALVWKKEKVHWNFYTSFTSEVINIDFWPIWHFDVKGTGWVGLEVSIIFMRTVGRFDMWVTPYTGILTLAKLKYFMYKDLSTKTL